MKILYLFADTIEQTDQLKKESFGITIGNEKFLQNIFMHELDFYELMKSLNEEKSIKSQTTEKVGKIQRVKFIIEV